MKNNFTTGNLDSTKLAAYSTPFVHLKNSASGFFQSCYYCSLCFSAIFGRSCPFLNLMMVRSNQVWILVAAMKFFIWCLFPSFRFLPQVVKSIRSVFSASFWIWPRLFAVGRPESQVLKQFRRVVVVCSRHSRVPKFDCKSFEAVNLTAYFAILIWSSLQLNLTLLHSCSKVAISACVSQSI